MQSMAILSKARRCGFGALRGLAAPVRASHAYNAHSEGARQGDRALPIWPCEEAPAVPMQAAGRAHCPAGSYRPVPPLLFTQCCRPTCGLSGSESARRRWRGRHGESVSILQSKGWQQTLRKRCHVSNLRCFLCGATEELAVYLPQEQAHSLPPSSSAADSAKAELLKVHAAGGKNCRKTAETRLFVRSKSKQHSGCAP